HLLMASDQVAPAESRVEPAIVESLFRERCEIVIAHIGAEAIDQQPYGNPAIERPLNRRVNLIAGNIVAVNVIEQADAAPRAVDQGKKRCEPLRPLREQGQPIAIHFDGAITRSLWGSGHGPSLEAPRTAGKATNR